MAQGRIVPSNLQVIVNGFSQLFLPEEADEVRKATVNWNGAYKGIITYNRRYGIVVHGIKTNAIDLDSDHKDTVKEWESKNQERGIKIEQITTLGKKGKHRPTTPW